MGIGRMFLTYIGLNAGCRSMFSLVSLVCKTSLEGLRAYRSLCGSLVCQELGGSISFA